MRSAIVLVGCIGLVASGMSAGCDEKEATKTSAPDSAPLARLIDASPPGSTSATSANGGSISDAGPTFDGSMPPRPVPKTSPTVGSGMPMETQMQAIAYMAAMGSP